MSKKESTTAADKTAHASKTATEQGVQYHFAGSGQYQPLTVTATSREEAEKKWEKERKAVNKNTTPEGE